MPVLTALFLCIFGLTFLIQPWLGSHWSWEAGNGLGFVALAGMAYLVFPFNVRKDQKAHEVLAYGVLIITALHSLWFLITDDSVSEYIKPGAPLYMWSGVVSVLLLYVLVLIAMQPRRMRIHPRYRIFRQWHRWLAFASLATAGYHVVASGFYLGHWLTVLVMSLILAFCLLQTLVRLTQPQNKAARIRHYLYAGSLSCVAFALLKSVTP